MYTLCNLSAIYVMLLVVVLGTRLSRQQCKKMSNRSAIHIEVTRNIDANSARKPSRGLLLGMDNQELSNTFTDDSTLPRLLEESQETFSTKEEMIINFCSLTFLYFDYLIQYRRAKCEQRACL